MKRTYFILIAITFNFILSTFSLFAQWQHFNFTGLKIYNTNSKYMYSVATNSTYFLRTTDDWQHWDTVQTGFPIYRFAADSTEQILLAQKTGSYTGDLYLSQHQNPFYFLTSLTEVTYYNLYIHKNYIYVLNQLRKIYRSTNFGNSFDSIQVLSNTSGTTIGSISAICDSILYAFCTEYISPYNQYNIASFDGGNTWNYYNNYLTGIPLVNVSPYIFAGKSNNVYCSIDGGHTYSSCSPNIGTVKSFAYGNGVLLAGTDSMGVYATTNKGNTWVAFNDGLDSLCCNAYVAVTDSFYYVTLNDSITYRRSIHDLTSVSSLTEELPLQLYPNPATDYLTIKSGNYRPFTYQLINMQGSLQKQGNISGSQTEINVAGLPRGMYVLKVVTEKQTVTKKVVLQ